MLQKWLLAAGVMFLEALEIWYELEACQSVTESDQVTLAFRAVSETSACLAMNVVVMFGPKQYRTRLDLQGRAMWSVPLQGIQDERTKRIVAPVIVILNDECSS